MSAKDVLKPTPEISVIVPLFNEQDSITPLYGELVDTLEAMGRPFELLWVNDGSTDDSEARLDQLQAEDDRVSVIHLRRNFGKAAALTAGFRHARAERVVTLDADLQDDPAEIPRLLAAIESGFDVASGWKKVRRDPWSKRLPSRVFNWVVRLSSGLALHDFNCGFKAYRREALIDLHLDGELHRYVPMLLFWRGFRITEVVVQHRPRQHGRSKYGAERYLRGFFDLLTVLLHTRYRTRPLHFFGVVGGLLSLIGGGILTYLTVLWFLGHRPIGTRPLLFLGLLLVMVGIQLVSTGLLGELVRHAAKKEQPSFVVRRVACARDQHGRSASAEEG